MNSTKSLFLIITLFQLTLLNAQHGWQWTVLPQMPQAVANNAVVAGISNDTMSVYSFCGIDASLSPSGIHLKSFKYNTISGIWSILNDVPDTDGKIAAGASLINGRIYLAGGYYVASNLSEISSDKLHVFNPQSDSWMDDAMNIPVPIDDHVQVSYNDSLLYLITGWSNTTNVSAVQVYNTYDDSWEAGSPVPSNTAYRVFGASGAVVGDTIYYAGGVKSSGQFSAGNRMRKGVIADNPLEIEWSLLDENPGNAIYRSAVLTHENKVYWLGGTGDAYNFDGLAYDNSGPSTPEPRILAFDTNTMEWNEGEQSPFAIMDFRGAAQIAENEWIICGGMTDGPEVSNQAYLLTFESETGTQESILSPCIEWNCAGERLKVTSKCGNNIHSLSLYNRNGQLLKQSKVGELNYPFQKNELYIFHVNSAEGTSLARISFMR